ncbi:DUF423 domain-containing protein [uncultured Lutibacter sp.]|uniref:DUF423 domain-containing protein n=1 Tax=uncultured Lutibacter sp. TaxID=437739 RepID=UPI0026284528|nr:DUF423 domain-containing protein [uncultured Lutibacter sp.]
MNKNLFVTAILGATTIILGAFGAHALQETLSLQELKSFETGVRYQMYHVLVLLFVNTFKNFTKKSKNVVSMLFFVGILFFSGSIYAITFGVDAKSIWFVTPLGGLILIVGWIFLAIEFLKKKAY